MFFLCLISSLEDLSSGGECGAGEEPIDEPREKPTPSSVLLLSDFGTERMEPFTKRL